MIGPLSLAEEALAIFLATVQFSDLSEWERRRYRYFKLTNQDGPRP